MKLNGRLASWKIGRIQRGWPLIIQFVIFELRGYWYIDMLEMAQNRFEALPQVQD